MSLNERYLTVFEVAEHFRLNPQTVRNWIDAGTLPAVRLGRRVRVRESDLEQFIAAQNPDLAATLPSPTLPPIGDAEISAIADRWVGAATAMTARKWHLSKRDREAVVDAFRALGDAAHLVAEALSRESTQTDPSGSSGSDLRGTGQPGASGPTDPLAP